ncbi:MFS transporter [Chloroflexota bacterium]
MNNYKSSWYGRHFFYGYIVVVAALLITILNYGARNSFGVFFKPTINEFDWTRTLISGAFTISMLFQAIGAPLLGRLNDKLGPRFVMTLCGLLLGIGFLLMSHLSNIWQLYLFYGLVIGISMGGQFVSLLSTIARWFTKRRGVMTGIVIAGIGIGGFIMAPVANYLISIYDWRLSYIILGSSVLVIGILAAQFLRRDPAKMGVIPYGANSEVKQGLAAGEEGLSLREAIHTKQFLITLIIFTSSGYCLMTMNVHLVPHITDLGISTTIAANILAAIGALTAVGCIVLGGFADRIGNKQVCIISFIALVAGIFGFAFVKQIWAMYLCAAVFGIGVGGTAPIESTITAELFGMKSHGSIFGIISAGFTLGGALGPFVTAFLFDVTGNYQTAFLVCAGVGTMGLLFSILLKPIVRSSNRING